MDKVALSPKLLARALAKSKDDIATVAKKMESIPKARSKWKPEHFKLEKDMERLKRRESSFHTGRSTRERAAGSAKTTRSTPKGEQIAPVGEKTNVKALKETNEAMSQGGARGRRVERQMARQQGRGPGQTRGRPPEDTPVGASKPQGVGPGDDPFAASSTTEIRGAKGTAATTAGGARARAKASPDVSGKVQADAPTRVRSTSDIKAPDAGDVTKVTAPAAVAKKPKVQIDSSGEPLADQILRRKAMPQKMRGSEGAKAEAGLARLAQPSSDIARKTKVVKGPTPAAAAKKAPAKKPAPAAQAVPEPTQLVQQAPTPPVAAQPAVAGTQVMGGAQPGATMQVAAPPPPLGGTQIAGTPARAAGAKPPARPTQEVGQSQIVHAQPAGPQPGQVVAPGQAAIPPAPAAPANMKPSLTPAQTNLPAVAPAGPGAPAMAQQGQQVPQTLTSLLMPAAAIGGGSAIGGAMIGGGMTQQPAVQQNPYANPIMMKAAAANRPSALVIKLAAKKKEMKDSMPNVPDVLTDLLTGKPNKKDGEGRGDNYKAEPRHDTLSTPKERQKTFNPSSQSQAAPSF
jgi:hypothetical protein